MLVPRLRSVRVVCSVLALALAAGCGGGDDGDSGPRVPVKVMTRNLYLGSDLVSVIQAQSMEDIYGKVSEFWNNVTASKFPSRVKAIAAEIEATKPDLIGLQEVEEFRTQTPSDFDVMAPAINAETVELDFLALLLAELEARGLKYNVAAKVRHSDAELPGRNAAGMLFDVRMIDHDVILAREGVETSNPRTGQFENRIEYKIAGMVPIRVVRGFGFVDVVFQGARFTFGNSHLEVGGPLAVYQEAQANDLVKRVDAISGPLILVGDFNSPADGSGTVSYRLLTNRLTDAFTKLKPGEPGFTCCSSLSSPTFNGRSRIDLVLFRGNVKAESIEIVGTDPAKRTPEMLWPADHAGVVSGLSVAQ